jgi:hypothetical protein
VKEDLLADPQMLNTAAIANLLSMFEKSVRPKCKRGEILSLESARRGIWCPARKVLEGCELLPALPCPASLPCWAPIRGGSSGSCSSAPASSAAIAPSIPSAIEKSTALWPSQRTPPPAPFLIANLPIRWRPGALRPAHAPIGSVWHHIFLDCL